MPKLIERLERFSRTDVRYLLHGGTWLTVSNVVASATAFVSSIAFAYFVPQHTFGVYQYVLAMFGLFAIATFPKVNEAMVRAIARGFEGEFLKTIRVRMRWGLIGSAVGLAVSGYYFWQGNSDLGWAFLIVGLFVCFADPLGVFGDYLKAKRLFKEASIIRACTRITTLALMVGVIWYTQDLIYMVLAYFVIYATLRGISHLIVVRWHPPNTAQDADTIRYGKSLSLLAAFKAGVAQLDKILVFQYLGPLELAVYFFATAPVDQLRSVFAALVDLAMPKFSKAEGGTLRATLLPKVIRFEFLVLVPMVLGYIYFIPYVFPLVFPAYAEHVFYTQLYALSLLFFPISLFSTALVAQKKEGALWVSRVLIPLIRLGILIPAVYIGGLTGIIIGILIASAVELAINVVAFFWSIAPTDNRLEDAPRSTDRPRVD